MIRTRIRRWAPPAIGLAAAVLGRRIMHTRAAIDLHGRVVLITGSSRGLGLAMAREFAAQGCRLVLCARDATALERARQDAARWGTDVLAVPCDITDPAQVHDLVARATERFGQIDILVNNAGSIEVAPLAHQTLGDFRVAMDVMFWGALYPIFEVLPAMRARHAGRIVNITSIGGKVSVPHLLPYSAAKFAAVGLSEGLRAELAREGIRVTTVVPGLMRTGSHLNARFKGRNRQEFTWFSLGATLPFTSMSADSAARRIVLAAQRGESEVILGWQAQTLARVHGLMPGVTTQVLEIVNRILPGPSDADAHQSAATGQASRTRLTDSFIERLGHRAAHDLNED